MRACPALVVACLLGVSSTVGSAEPGAGDVFAGRRIVEVMRKVRDYQLDHPWKETDRNWIRATYYTGVMGLYRATRDPEILAQARRWAEKHDWAEGDEREPANKKTCGQTYLELHFIEPAAANIAKIRAYVDSRIAEIAAGTSPREGWYYCDTLYVGPPTIAMLGKATGEQKYYDYLNDVYWDVVDHLLDEEYGLFYRDKRYFDAKTDNGGKVFWSRGNGWVIGGIPRILQYLPKDHERYDDYVDLLQRMAAAIAPRQGDDGLWRSNLDDPDQHPNPETSGTAFFCYAMAWAVNNGVLDGHEFLPVVMKAWEGLVRHVHPDGKLGFVQPVGAEPKPATEDMTHEYAMGLFLLAGEEVLKLVESGAIDEARRAQHATGHRQSVHGGRPPSSDATQVVDVPLSDRFALRDAPGTGRRAVRLTSGDAFCYPLYYFIPSMTADAKYLIYHRAGGGEVQLHRLNLRTGESVQLTHGNTPRTRWKNWCVESGRGVLDHRSVLNVARSQVVYFTGPLGNDVRLVDVESLQDRLLFTLPDDREAVGQNGATPNGRWLVYIDSPRGSMYRQPVKGARVMGYHFDTQEHRVLCEIDCHVHHVLAYDDEHFIFCHPPNGMGMMITDLTSGKWEHLRAGDPGVPVPAGDDGVRGHVCHFVATRRGICYEVLGHKERREGQRSGLYDPLTRRRFEFLLPERFGYTHTGWDPQGRLWFWEDAARGHRLVYLKRLGETGGEFVDLTGPWKTYASGQKSHFHPQLTPDRRWILFTGGDAKSETNHLFLLDVSDLKDTEGISPEKLSPTGANDLTRSGPPGNPVTVAAWAKSVALGGLACLAAAAPRTAAEEKRPHIRIRGIYGGVPAELIGDGKTLADNGINAVFMSSRGLSAERIGLLKEQGARVFAEFNTMHVAGYLKDHPDAAPVGADGEVCPAPHGWQGICPTHPGYRKSRMDAFRQVLNDFEIDGIWLDYHHGHASWERAEPSLPDTCFCERCIAQFARETGTALPDEPPSQLAGRLLDEYKPKWVQWRCDVFTDWVREFRAIVDETRPNALLGTFHCPWTDTERNGALRAKLAIDLRAQAKYVDVLSIMPYHARFGHPADPSWISRRTAWLGRHLGIRGEPRERPMIWPIVQLSDWGHTVPADDVRAVLDHGTRLPATGVMVFNWGSLRRQRDKVDEMTGFYRQIEP